MIKEIFGAAVAAALVCAGSPAFANEATSDGFPPAQNLSYYNVPGADQATDGVAAPFAGSAYLFLAGSAFTPRTSSQTVTYSGGGCSYSDAALTTSLELPDNAMIQGVRLFYYSTAPANLVGMFLTRYTGDGSFTDLLTGTSTISTGYASEYFSLPAPVAIDNSGQSYALTATMVAGARLCGMRVFYSP